MTSRVIDGVIYEFEPGTSEATIQRFVTRKQAEAAPALAPRRVAG